MHESAELECGSVLDFCGGDCAVAIHGQLAEGLRGADYANGFDGLDFDGVGRHGEFVAFVVEVGEGVVESVGHAVDDFDGYGFGCRGVGLYAKFGEGCGEPGSVCRVGDFHGV